MTMDEEEEEAERIAQVLSGRVPLRRECGSKNRVFWRCPNCEALHEGYSLPSIMFSKKMTCDSCGRTYLKYLEGKEQ